VVRVVAQISSQVEGEVLPAVRPLEPKFRDGRRIGIDPLGASAGSRFQPALGAACTIGSFGLSRLPFDSGHDPYTSELIEPQYDDTRLQSRRRLDRESWSPDAHPIRSPL